MPFIHKTEHMAAASFEIFRVCDSRCERKVNITQPGMVSLLFHSLNRSFRRNQSSQAQTAETRSEEHRVGKEVIHIYHVMKQKKYFYFSNIRCDNELELTNHYCAQPFFSCTRRTGHEFPCNLGLCLSFIKQNIWQLQVSRFFGFATADVKEK